MNRITKGEGGNGTIYERLRKRSYRRMQALYEHSHQHNHQVDWSQEWSDMDHKAYLAGVHDALIANEKAWTPRLTSIGVIA